MPNPAPGSLIGPGLHKQIKDTIAKVDGLPIGGEVIRIPTELGGSEAFVPTKKIFRVATYSGEWNKNGQKPVQFLNSTEATVSVTNLFYDLPNNGTSTCAIVKEGTAWYLVQDVHTTITVITDVSLGTAGLVFTRAILNVVSTATAGTVSISTTTCA